jgi:hypothetical protein
MNGREINAKQMVARCLNALSTQYELSGPMVMAFLLGHGDHYTNEEFESLYWFQIHPHLNRLQLISDGNIETTEQATVEIDPETNRVSITNQIMDYRMRPSALETCSWFDYVSQYRKYKRTARTLYFF